MYENNILKLINYQLFILFDSIRIINSKLKLKKIYSYEKIMIKWFIIF
jgi:hypothetical protein